MKNVLCNIFEFWRVFASSRITELQSLLNQLPHAPTRIEKVRTIFDYRRVESARTVTAPDANVYI